MKNLIIYNGSYRERGNSSSREKEVFRIMSLIKRVNSSRFYLPAVVALIVLFNFVSMTMLSGCDDKNSKRGENEPNNSFETCNLVRPDITINAVVDPSGDDDYFCFDVDEEGTIVTGEVFDFELLTPFIEFYGPGPNHELLAAGSTFLEDEVGLPLGRHFIVVGDSNGDGGPDYNYKLRITLSGPTPPPTATPTAPPTGTPPPTATPTAPPTGTPPPTATPTPTPEIIEISMEDNVFVPADITISVGDTVRWTNNGALNHDAQSDDGTTFNSESEFPLPSGMEPGDSFEFTFNAEGEIPYFCVFHGGPGGIGMSGTITVEP
ncbi:MAG: plastocyanin/azurin family copper-binding protein [Candidatus Dadabacteria bacterium]